MKQTGGKTLRSGALAKATGVSADTIRHYERIGVLPRTIRTASGYRVYPEVAVNRVLVVQRALSVGFTLAELAEIFKTRDAGGAPCVRVYALAEEKLAGIQQDLAALKQAEKKIKQLLARWKDQLKQAGPGKQAHLLLSLTEVLSTSPTLRNSFRRKGKS
jgi:MerR family transcriptional regulator, copper efflux regulator